MPSISAIRASAASSVALSLERQPEVLILERVIELVREHDLAERSGVAPVDDPQPLRRGS